LLPYRFLLIDVHVEFLYLHWLDLRQKTVGPLARFPLSGIKCSVIFSGYSDRQAGKQKKPANPMYIQIS